jgi:hypothetical protein
MRGGDAEGAVAAAVRVEAAARARLMTTTTEENPFGFYARGFRSVYKPRREGALLFAELLVWLPRLNEPTNPLTH